MKEKVHQMLVRKQKVMQHPWHYRGCGQ